MLLQIPEFIQFIILLSCGMKYILPPLFSQLIPSPTVISHSQYFTLSFHNSHLKHWRAFPLCPEPTILSWLCLSSLFCLENPHLHSTSYQLGKLPFTHQGWAQILSPLYSLLSSFHPHKINWSFISASTVLYMFPYYYIYLLSHWILVYWFNCLIYKVL